MYRYDEYDNALIKERAAQFRHQIARWQAGELTDDEFRPLRLQNGLYIQRQAPMLRIAVPYGMISSTQLRALAYVAKTWDKGYGHFTTRHNLQFNWTKIEDCPDILDYLAAVGMHAIQTSGNCIRNITTDPFAGVAPDETLNPLPLAEILRQWSTLHPEFAFLPRKFKIAISGAKEDRALVWFHDVGLLLSRHGGETCFTVIVGGGLGRTPLRGQVLRENLPWQHILTYLEAIIRIYNLYGRRDNLYKARLKILVQHLGLEEFARQVEDEWRQTQNSPALLTQEEYERIAGRFNAPAYKNLPDDTGLAGFPQKEAAFPRWLSRCVRAHKKPGYACVTLSLKAPGQAPGDISAKQMEAVADLAERFSFGEARSSQHQNLILADVEQSRLYELWQAASASRLATPTVGLLTDIVSCPGGEFCDLANARSVPLVHHIQARFQDMDYLFDLGGLRFNVSGCVNACSHHHLGHIGILGVDKNKEEYYQITLGGRQGNDAKIGTIMGPALPAADIPGAVETLICFFVERRHPDESFLDTFDRIGIMPFKERLYGNAFSRRGFGKGDAA